MNQHRNAEQQENKTPLRVRRAVQAISTLLSIPSCQFLKGRVHQGPLKQVCAGAHVIRVLQPLRRVQ